MSLATENIKDEKSCVAKTQDFLAFCIERNSHIMMNHPDIHAFPDVYIYASFYIHAIAT